MSNLHPIDVVNNVIPSEGKRAIPLPLNFAAVQTLSFDLTMMVNNKGFSCLQAIYYSNDFDVNLFITFGTSQQAIVLPPRSAGYLRVLSVQPPKITIASASGGVPQVILLNYQADTSVWSTVQAGATDLTPVITRLDTIITELGDIELLIGGTNTLLTTISADTAIVVTNTGNTTTELQTLNSFLNPSNKTNAFTFGVRFSPGAGNFAHIGLFNPIGSGVTVAVTGATIGPDGNSFMRLVTINAALTGTSVAGANLSVGGAGSQARFQTQANAAVLGTQIAFFSVAGTNPLADKRNWLDPIFLTEGFGIAYVADLGLGNSVSYFWREEV